MFQIGTKVCWDFHGEHEGIVMESGELHVLVMPTKPFAQPPGWIGINKLRKC